MSTHVRHPIWLPALKAADARTFASLYAVESFARATVSSVIPIQAYEILHNEQIVSILYTIVALLGLSVTLFMPMLIRRFARRWVYTAGACLLAIGSLFFVTHTLAGQLAGMLCRVMGASALSITLNLYIMDHIRKTDFMQAESLRMAWSMFAWTGGPTLGIFLYTRFGIYAAHGAVAVFALALLALFWTYRLGDNPSIRPGKTRPANPLANIGRFVAQPRLRLAWLIAFGRSCFWTTFFVYGPLFMVITGEGKLAGGLLVSAGNALLFMAIFWGKAGKRFGGRRTMTFAYFAMSAMLMAAGAVGETAPLLTGAFLLVRRLLHHCARRAGLDRLHALGALLRAGADGGGLPHLSRLFRTDAAAGLFGGAGLLRAGLGVRHARPAGRGLRLRDMAVSAEVA